ncbi:MAG: methyltransferase domain-containing protein [Betaproteobacteria bacterium]
MTSQSVRWDTAVRPMVDAREGRLWRNHSDAVNGALVSRWLEPSSRARILKTDLFDEAMGVGLVPLLATRAQRIAAIDIATSVLGAAAARYPRLDVVGADVRHLPFADATFDAVVSNSTLDHFAARDDIGASLVELHRVLRPGGRLVLTMDNLRHPAVALRNAMPMGLLRRIGLVPYPIGKTVGPRRLLRIVRAAGFEVVDVDALLHCPRTLAVLRARRLDREGDPGSHRRFLKGLGRWERLARLPTRFLTGHYVGVLARKT